MRDDKGKFIKGAKPNPTGRPKSFRISDADRVEIGEDPHQALVWLLKKAESRDELFRYAKELLPFARPKLSSVKQEINEVREIRISWGGDDQPTFGSIEVNEPKTIEMQADVDRLGLTKEDLKEAMARLSEPKRGRGRPKKETK